MTAEDLRKTHPDIVGQIEREAEARGAAAAKPAAASIAQLKDKFPGDGRAAFRERCLEKGLTIDQARGEFADEVARERDAANARAEKAEARAQELEKLGQAGQGVPAVGAGGAGAGGGGKPRSYDEAVAGVMMEDPKLTRTQAIAAVNARWPDLREAYANG